MNLRTIYLICTLLVGQKRTAGAQPHSFAQYRVDIYKGQRAKPIIKGNKLAEEFRTIIRDTYYSKDYIKSWHGSTGLNFAGHYCLVYWGCGTSCSESAVVDVKTGIVYPGVDANLDYEFKRNSRLIIVNQHKGAPDSALFSVQYWVWNDEEKKFHKIR